MVIKRGIDLQALTWGAPEAASGGWVRMTATIVNGIEDTLAKRINKDIRDEKFKAKVQIEGDKLRVFSPSRDELQNVIALRQGAGLRYPAAVQQPPVDPAARHRHRPAGGVHGPPTTPRAASEVDAPPPASPSSRSGARRTRSTPTAWRRRSPARSSSSSRHRRGRRRRGEHVRVHPRGDRGVDRASSWTSRADGRPRLPSACWS